MPSTKADNKLVKKPVNKPVDNVVESVAQLRRCKSVTRAEEIQHEEKKLREQQPDQPCHKPRASLFSWASGFDNFNGFINWAFLLLCLGGIRLMLENLNKYGIRANPIYWWLLSLEGLSSLPSTGIPPSVYLLIASNWQVLFTLFIERLLAAEIVAESIGLFLHVSSTGWWPSLSNVEYPDNLTVKDIYYFMSAPTLCYELNFPRTNRIRTGFVVKRLLEVILGSNLLLFLFQQWIIPSVKNSLIPFSEMDVLLMGERLIKLAIPNHLLWLIWFYLFFHSWLNMLAEVVQFADRLMMRLTTLSLL
ncbi:unnamed protein product [Cyprideis torosa]|uniref:diacylglycerol O-acyltransferase n=1 Tax=Cyprideis torosa TaxID=163714 RepID=A0A7R8W2Y8_9CRUS|nr:unnamed protein product [Cyprideis torosa]CAG0882480.1 unnamed protein product [Cyprideis torosa]